MKITIPKPCHENWETMTPAEKGRFCSVCSKTVRDFTIASDEEIIDIFSNSSEEICGNFNESQLNKNLQYSYINSLFAKFAVGFVITAGGISSVNAQQCETKNDTLKESRIKIKGKVQGVTISPKKDTLHSEKLILGGIQSVNISDYKPLFVADGKIINEKKFRTIDQNSIEKMDVLKGASATALYGEKGKNGVILVTTKKKK